jgi:uncharacterized membrane protein YidH (DUF202 family)
MTDHAFHQEGGGLAAERTDLAWNRSGLALLACGALVLKGLPAAGLAPRHVVGVAILGIGAFVWALGGFEATRRSRAAPAPATPRGLFAVAFGTTAVGAAVFVLAAFYPG